MTTDEGNAKRRRGFFRRERDSAPEPAEQRRSADAFDDPWSASAWDDWDDDFTAGGQRSSVPAAAAPRPEAVDAWLQSEADDFDDTARKTAKRWGGDATRPAADDTLGAGAPAFSLKRARGPVESDAPAASGLDDVVDAAIDPGNRETIHQVDVIVDAPLGAPTPATGPTNDVVADDAPVITSPDDDAVTPEDDLIDDLADVDDGAFDTEGGLFDAGDPSEADSPTDDTEAPNPSALSDSPDDAPSSVIDDDWTFDPVDTVAPLRVTPEPTAGSTWDDPEPANEASNDAEPIAAAEPEATATVTVRSLFDGLEGSQDQAAPLSDDQFREQLAAAKAELTDGAIAGDVDDWTDANALTGLDEPLDAEDLTDSDDLEDLAVLDEAPSLPSVDTSWVPGPVADEAATISTETPAPTPAPAPTAPPTPIDNASRFVSVSVVTAEDREPLPPVDPPQTAAALPSATVADVAAGGPSLTDDRPSETTQAPSADRSAVIDDASPSSRSAEPSSSSRPSRRPRSARWADLAAEFSSDGDLDDDIAPRPRRPRPEPGSSRTDREPAPTTSAGSSMAAAPPQPVRTVTFVEPTDAGSTETAPVEAKPVAPSNELPAEEDGSPLDHERWTDVEADSEASVEAPSPARVDELDEPSIDESERPLNTPTVAEAPTAASAASREAVPPAPADPELDDDLEALIVRPPAPVDPATSSRAAAAPSADDDVDPVDAAWDRGLGRSPAARPTAPATRSDERTTTAARRPSGTPDATAKPRRPRDDRPSTRPTSDGSPRAGRREPGASADTAVAEVSSVRREPVAVAANAAPQPELSTFAGGIGGALIAFAAVRLVLTLVGDQPAIRTTQTGMAARLLRLGQAFADAGSTWSIALLVGTVVLVLPTYFGLRTHIRRWAVLLGFALTTAMASIIAGVLQVRSISTLTNASTAHLVGDALVGPIGFGVLTVASVLAAARVAKRH